MTKRDLTLGLSAVKPTACGSNMTGHPRVQERQPSRILHRSEISGNDQKEVWTMSTLWVLDWVVPVPDWAGFGIYQAVCDSWLVLWLMPAWDGGAGAVGLFRYR